MLAIIAIIVGLVCLLVGSGGRASWPGAVPLGHHCSRQRSRPAGYSLRPNHVRKSCCSQQRRKPSSSATPSSPRFANVERKFNESSSGSPKRKRTSIARSKAWSAVSNAPRPRSPDRTHPDRGRGATATPGVPRWSASAASPRTRRARSCSPPSRSRSATRPAAASARSRRKSRRRPACARARSSRPPSSATRRK